MRICMPVYSFYELDSRVLHYAESLAARGDDVEVLSLNDGQGAPQETLRGVKITRIQTRAGRESHPLQYLWRMARFCLKAAWIMARRHARAPYDLIHAHNIPDFIVFSALGPRRKGARVILDIHDLVAEFYANKFAAGMQSAACRMLLWIERRSARFAHHVIVANHLWRERLVRRAVDEAHCSVFINYVDTKVFFPRPRTRRDDRLVLVYPGGLQWHQGLDLALRAFAMIGGEFPRAEFQIYGRGSAEDGLRKLAEELRLAGRVHFHDLVALDQVADIMANADVGLVPKRADSFGDEAYSTKILEYMTQSLPVVASRTKVDSYYFGDGSVRFFESGNVEALAAALREVLSKPEVRAELVRKGLAQVASNAWDARQHEYLALVDRLVAEGRKGGGCAH